MMHKLAFSMVITAIVGISACAGLQDAPSAETFLHNLQVSETEIFGGGRERDGKESLQDPDFVAPDDAHWLRDDHLVIGVSLEGESRAYPARILARHEVVNDRFGGTRLAVTYCPLCGSAAAYDREHRGQVLEFGFSGLLYNGGTLLYDRSSHSLWPQMTGRAISGPRAREKLRRVPVTHTTWQDWKERHPGSRVLSRETGHDHDYDHYPYRDYELEHVLPSPIKHRDRTYHPKELVIGIEQDGRARAWPLIELDSTVGSVTDEFMGREVEIRYNRTHQSASVYDRGQQLPESPPSGFPGTPIFQTRRHSLADLHQGGLDGPYRPPQSCYNRAARRTGTRNDKGTPCPARSGSSSILKVKAPPSGCAWRRSSNRNRRNFSI